MSKYALFFALLCIPFLNGCKDETVSTTNSAPARKSPSGEASDRSASSDPFAPRDPLENLTSSPSSETSTPDNPPAVTTDGTDIGPGSEQSPSGSAFSQPGFSSNPPETEEKSTFPAPVEIPLPDPTLTETEEKKTDSETTSKSPDSVGSVWNVVPLDDVGKTPELGPDANAMPIPSPPSPSETETANDADPDRPTTDLPATVPASPDMNSAESEPASRKDEEKTPDAEAVDSTPSEIPSVVPELDENAEKMPNAVEEAKPVGLDLSSPDSVFVGSMPPETETKTSEPELVQAVDSALSSPTPETEKETSGTDSAPLDSTPLDSTLPDSVSMTEESTISDRDSTDSDPKTVLDEDSSQEDSPQKDSSQKSGPVFAEVKAFDDPVKPSGAGAKFTEAKPFSDPVADEKVADEKPDEKLTESTKTPATSGPEKISSKDPLAELFVDWPEPKLLLVFTGFLNGYVEPCGCAGMEQMKGGLSRRHTLFKSLEQKGWPVLAVDAGNLNKGFGRQEELKFNFVIDESLRLMKYGAVGMGNRELLMPIEELIVYTVDIPGDPKRYTSANTAVLAFDPNCTAPYRVLEKDGLKVGVVSVLGSSHFKEINNPDIKHDDPVKRLKLVLPQLIAEECDRTVLIVHGTTQEMDAILKELPDRFDFVIGSDTPAEPPLRPNWIENSMLVEVGEKGKFVVAVGLFDDKEKPWRYQRIPLDSRFANSANIVDLMKLYQEQLEETGLEGLGIKPITDARTAENGKYVGSKVCADCHEPSFGVWKKSRHASAWRSLAETSQPARTHDPECIACHVVGWNPSEFLPYENGFLDAKRTPLLLDVGCESCHGPGENHAKAEQPGGDETLRLKLRRAVRLPVEGNAAKKRCIECHDGDNSPHFDFDVYWPKIVHPETEE